MKKWGVRHHITSAKVQHRNLRAETAVKSAKRIIKDSIGRGGSLENDKFITSYLQYINTPVRDIGLSPAQMIYARDLRDGLPTRKENLLMRKEWVLNQKEKLLLT